MLEMYDTFLNIYKEYKVGKLSTGIPRFDLCLQGGFEEGSLIDLRGETGSGKSLIGLSVIKSNIEKNIIYVNANKKYNIDFLKKAQINPSNIRIIDTNIAEDIFNILFRIIPEKLADIIIIDDIACLKSKYNDSDKVAEILNYYMRDFLWCISKHKSIAIFINQNRSIMGKRVYMAQKTLNRSAKYILELSKVALLRYENDYIGQSINIKTLKPLVDLGNINIKTFYNRGVDDSIELIEFGIQFNILEKKGNWIFFKDINIGNGLYNASMNISNNLSLFKEIKEKINKLIMEHHG